ncbi:hypothetical protein [Streptomyces flavofungini]|nr:hypothetical protein [Streptomyces flavofungini]
MTALQGQAVRDKTIGAKLHELMALATGIAGWTAYDDGDHATAALHYRSAIKLADTGRAAEVGAYFATLLASQHCTTGHPAAALDLLESRAAAARHAAPSTQTAAALHLVAARAHAALNDTTTCLRELGDACSALETSTQPMARSLASWLTTSSLEIETGRILLALDRPRQACRHIDTSDISDVGRHLGARQECIYRTYAAQAHLRVGNLDVAIEHAHRAQDCLDAVVSFRAAASMERLRRNISSFAGTPQSREFLRRRA